MMISLSDTLPQTSLFIALFLGALLLTSRRRLERCTLSPHMTAELKGVAILAVIFAHIGHFLVEDHRFLVPLSLSAGVGVNLFLVLSGYGLTYSMMRRSSSLLEFYRRRVSRIFIPLWIALFAILFIDRVFLDISYPIKTMAHAFVGFFPQANIYEDINAPLWYLTIALFYYAIYPILFFKRFPIVSSLLITATGYAVTKQLLPVDEDVLDTYRLHVFAFPLGVFCAAVFCTEITRLKNGIKKLTDLLSQPGYAPLLIRIACATILSLVVAYTTIHANIGKEASLEQRTSLVTTMALIGIFILKPFEIRFLSLMGRYSYEMYLIHWPLLYRYDLFYSWLPGAIATWTSLLFFLGMSHLIQMISKQIRRITTLDKGATQ